MAQRTQRTHQDFDLALGSIVLGRNQQELLPHLQRGDARNIFINFYLLLFALDQTKKTARLSRLGQWLRARCTTGAPLRGCLVG